MEFSQEKRHILQSIGFSDVDVNLYLDIDEKLETYRQVFCENINDPVLFTFFASLYFPKASAGPSGVEQFDQEKSAETHSALVNAVREQIERSMQPLRTTVDEIKASVAKELEEERLLLRDHLAAAQKEIMVQLQEIRHIQDQQLNQSEPCHQPDKDIQAEEINSQEQMAGQRVQQESMAEGPQKGISTAEKRSDGKGFDQQMADIKNELLWFKEQVQLLQNENKQYRQELRKQEQQQLLQRRVSVSKLELQEELGRVKDEIIISIKALWAFTEAELNDSSKSLNEKTTDAVCELSRCQEETKQILYEILTTASDTKALAKENSNELKEGTKQMLTTILTTALDTNALAKENSDELKKAHQVMEKSDMSKTIHSMEGKLDNIQKRVETETISVLENAFSDLHMICLGQAQRVIQTVVNPSYAPSKVFHFYLKNFQQLVGSGKRVSSPPYVVTIDNSILAMHLQVKFKTEPSEILLWLVSAADLRELGFESLESSKVTLDVRVKRFQSQDNILVAEGIKISQGFFSGSKFRYRELGKPISCPELVSSEYNNFKDDSVLIELKIR
ncbi:hypothetical protein PoB_004924400 [Plakobranchus ocellatus]|uniref:MATH domain-containing protein n=1 Tax=Plakobranchus ocellatus TaxID=259542 RepID=A0AAV4BWF9_9GAST|nr:hypothetical protein PoB_004924400 [Plakobranchus ocellatus]